MTADPAFEALREAAHQIVQRTEPKLTERRRELLNRAADEILGEAKRYFYAQLRTMTVNVKN